MIWCLTHADSAEDIVDSIVDSLSNHQVPVQKKVSLLYLLSVILCNCSSRAANASCFRRCFEARLPRLFKDLHEAHLQINTALEAEHFERQVLTCFHIWEECAIYTCDFLVTLENIFRGLIPMTPTDLNFDVTSHFSSSMGLIGLDNLGNTCFMSGALICLFNTRTLLEYCLCSNYTLDLNTKSSTLKGELMKSFVRVMEEMWRPGGAVRSVCSAVPLKEFKSCIAVYAKHFAGARQHDAHDFFVCLLRGLHEDTNNVCDKKQVISHSDKIETISSTEKAKLCWDSYIECNNSEFVDLFAGQTRSAVTCTICGYESNTMEAFTTLSLPIREAQSQVSLSDCFEGFCIEETLKGTDKVKCAKCRKRRVCTKKMTVQRFPKILVLHLNRFGEDASKKLLTRVDCPLTGLNLSKFTTATDCSGTTYSLYAVCNHSGTPEKGHYKAYAMHPYSGQWHEFDDNRVTSIPLTTVNSAEVFLLFYERQDSDVSSTDSC